MELMLGIVALALGVALIWMGIPKDLNPAFLPHGMMEFVYPVVCLITLFAGGAAILASFSIL